MKLIDELRNLEQKRIEISYDRASGLYSLRLTRRVKHFQFDSIVATFNKNVQQVSFRKLQTRKGRTQLVATWQCTTLENALATARSVSEALRIAYRVAQIQELESEIELTIAMNRTFPSPDVETQASGPEIRFATVDDDLPF